MTTLCALDPFVKPTRLPFKSAMVRIAEFCGDENAFRLREQLGRGLVGLVQAGDFGHVSVVSSQAMTAFIACFTCSRASRCQLALGQLADNRRCGDAAANEIYVRRSLRHSCPTKGVLPEGHQLRLPVWETILDLLQVQIRIELTRS